jgi:hypothetical protein
MRRWHTTKRENRAGAQIRRTEYKALSSIFIAEDLLGLGSRIGVASESSLFDT